MVAYRDIFVRTVRVARIPEGALPPFRGGSIAAQPSGNLTGTLMLHHGRRVLLLSASPFPRRRVGRCSVARRGAVPTTGTFARRKEVLRCRSSTPFSIQRLAARHMVTRRALRGTDCPT